MEEWRDVIGYEGLYQVSNLGNVKSLERTVWNGKGYRVIKEGILKAGKNGRGYLYVILFKGGKSKPCTVHRLVAEAFLENPENLPDVNHKDENKENNCVENLEWVSHEYNCNHGTRNRRIAEKLSIPIYGINKVSGLITEFKSTMEAERITGINHGNIVSCLKGRLKTAGNFYWIYAEEEN